LTASWIAWLFAVSTGILLLLTSFGCNVVHADILLMDCDGVKIANLDTNTVVGLADYRIMTWF